SAVYADFSAPFTLATEPQARGLSPEAEGLAECRSCSLIPDSQFLPHVHRYRDRARFQFLFWTGRVAAVGAAAGAARAGLPARLWHERDGNEPSQRRLLGNPGEYEATAKRAAGNS